MATTINPGPLLFVGFPGTSPTPRLKRLIRHDRIGGVILFRRNIESPRQLAALITTLQQWAAPERLLIGIDQEGGRVQRLPKPFTQWPPLCHLGRTESHELAYQLGQAIARELSAVGINLNFAPVLDVQTQTPNPIIGDRALSDRPMTVARLGLAFIHGLQDHGVIASGKHFPGHGDTSVDSHKTLPVVDAPADTLMGRELVPFTHAIANRLSTIMTAHVRYPALDPEWPATLSPAIVNTLLRQTLQFDGVVFSDDLKMKAITDHWPAADAAIQSLQAGVDALLICSDETMQAQVLEGLHRAIETGWLKADRIQQSLTRLQRLKAHYIKTRTPSSPHHGRKSSGKTVPANIGCAAHRELARRLSATSP